ncbi:MAG TPA: glutamate--tRNA ligase [Candidatus Thermoplasmatota archaeon]|nr:glutamate--tRNA ligase [Candidatus Thermoplasmatota archaeon]
MRLEETVRKFALQNALSHGGKAERGAVMSRVLGERSDLRAKAGEVAKAADRIIKEVNALTEGEQRKTLEALAPELLVERKAERTTGLPDLEGAVEGQVVMRFAPGPSGPLHIGHARAAVLNDEYCRRYKGKYILRLEDTDPARVLPEAYHMIEEDMAWMGCKVHEVVVQSTRFERYYEIAKRLLEIGKAYVCTCKPDDWRRLKDKKKPCPHRHLDPSSQLEAFQAMLSGGFGPEQAALIGQTDLSHPNPAVRDFPLLRIEDTPHPRTGTRYRVYPLMNFSVSVDDHDLGLTHVLRGKDHLNNTERQRYLFDHLGWAMPHYIHYGRVRIEGLELSTSKMWVGIQRGDFTGWDDVRLGTIRALSRRGYRPESIRGYWVDASVKEVDIVFSWKNLNAIDKKRADREACRLFFVGRPTAVDVEAPSDLVARPPRLPDDPAAGRRELTLRQRPGGLGRALIPDEDAARLAQGSVFRLKDLGNFTWSGEGKARYLDNDLASAKGAPILHWLPDDPAQALPATLSMPDGTRVEGRMEAAARAESGRVVQLERVGLARLDRQSSPPAEVVAFFLYR